MGAPMPARSLVLLALFAALIAPLPGPAAAETFPARAITVVVPFPPGGPTDALGRLVGERMGRALGQSVVIDNASGAGGTLGTAKVARAPADGYTLCVGQLNSHVFGPAVYLSAGRWRLAPEVPTFAERGFPGYEMPFWTGLFVRKGTPAEAICRLNAALVESLADSALARRITDLGQDIPPAEQQTPQTL